MSVFSERLKWLREKKGLTQQQMADKISISRSNYSKYEYGQREPTIDTLRKLPEVLGESVDFLIGVIDYDSEANEALNKLWIEVSHAQKMYHRFMSLKEVYDSSDVQNSEKNEAKEVLAYQIKLAQDGLINVLEETKKMRDKIKENAQSIPCISEENLRAMTNIGNKKFKEELPDLSNINLDF